MPVSDPILPEAGIRRDGRVMRPYHLFEVRKPTGSKGPYDDYKRVRTIAAKDAARPRAEGNCPLAK